MKAKPHCHPRVVCNAVKYDCRLSKVAILSLSSSAINRAAGVGNAIRVRRDSNGEIRTLTRR